MSAFLAESAHWGLAVIPVLLLLAMFVWLDAFRLTSMKEVLILLALGGVGALAAWPVAGRFLDTLPIGFSSYSRFAAPWIEEAIKGLIIIALFRMNRIGYKLDAVIAGFAIGAGFSVIENIFYLVRFPEYGAGTWLVRGLGTAVMHGATLAILAAIAHEFAERESREAASGFNFNLLWFVPGYLAAVAIHTVFNQFPDQPMLAMLGAAVLAPVTLIGIFHFGTAEAQGWLERENKAHVAELAALRSDQWPDTPAGRKIAALAQRLDPESARRVRRYWELQTWLVVEAEQAIMEEAAGDAIVDPVQVRAALTELDGLAKALGRTTLLALQALLPFSRNDLWEVDELKERLARHRAHA